MRDLTKTGSEIDFKAARETPIVWSVRAMKEITIQDIAAIANVSKSTVSRVLNNTTAVHPDKRKAVLDASARLGFEPNIVARSLASGRSMTIGVQTQCIGSPFYDAVSQGVVTGLGGTGYSPIFVDGQWQREAETQVIRALLGRRVDGLVLIGGDIPAEELSVLCGSTPTVIVARNILGQHRSIYMDNVDGGYRATNHLIEFGHRSIAIIRGIAHHPDASDRFEGYKKALAEANIEFDPGLVLDGDFSAESGVCAVNRLMKENKSFTAIFAANDMTAFGARLALHQHGLRVPEDVSIIGFDDQKEAAFMTPPLTTMKQPAREMGEQASRTILALIREEPFESQSLTGELQIRESVTRVS